MAGYIGHKPKVTNYTVDEFTTSAAQASSGNFTLSQTVDDSKTLEVSVGGIDQPQSAYTVTGTTLAFGASIVAENDIVIARHAGESISYPSLEDGAVTDAKIGTGAVTDGKLAASGTMPAWNGAALTNIVHTPADASVTNAKTNFLPGTTFKGDGASARGKITLNCEQNTHGVSIQSPAHSSAAAYTLTLPPNDGAADEFLKTDGSGVLSFGAAGGGAMTLIGSVVASDDATIGVTGIDATYDRYVIDFTDMVPASNAQDFYMRLGTSGGILSAGGYGYRTTYSHGGAGAAEDTSVSSGNDAMTTTSGTRYQIEITPAGTLGVGDTAPEGISGTMNLYIPHTQNSRPSWNWMAQMSNDTGNRHYYIKGHGQRADSSEDITQVQAFFQSGNVSTGRLTVWGVKHT